MKKLLCLLFVVLSIPAIAWCESETERDSTGYGSSYQEALSSALINAVREVRGVEVTTEKTISTIIQRQGVPADLTTISTEVKEQLFNQSQGAVKGFKVLSVKKPKSAEDSWEVTARVMVPEYKEMIENDTRKSIVVAPFDLPYSDAIADLNKLAKLNLSERLANKIQTKLSQSKKFAVLNRSYKSVLGKEYALWSSDKVAPEEKGRLSRKLGTDLVLVGSFQKLNFEEEAVSYYGDGYTKYEIDADISYSVIEAPTDKIIWTDSFECKASGKDEDKLISDFIAAITNSVAANTTHGIYPQEPMAKTMESLCQPKETPENSDSSPREPTPGSSEKPWSW